MLKKIPYFLWTFCLLLIYPVFSKEPQPEVKKNKTICLNMIVKNESSIIEKSLASVKPLIHYWVIVDTGSTDGTQQVIKDFMKDIPGELHERPWVDFAHNRNEALVLAKDKGDYVLFMDADEVLTFSKDFVMPDLIYDSYAFMMRQVGKGVDYQRVLLINNHLDWKWEGVLHETIVSEKPTNREIMPGIIVLSYTNGSRSQDPQKYLKDAQILEAALQKDPTNSRYVYYLAQSYLNVPDYPKALEYYQKRASMGGWDQEVFFSMYCAGMLQAALNMPSETFIRTQIAAYQYRPTRAEPLYRIAYHYMQTKNYFLGYLVSNYGLSIPLSKDSIFVETWIYEWGLLLQFAECAYHLGKYEEACCAIQKLLLIPTLPEETRKELQRNLELMTQNSK